MQAGKFAAPYTEVVKRLGKNKGRNAQFTENDILLRHSLRLLVSDWTYLHASRVQNHSNLSTLQKR